MFMDTESIREEVAYLLGMVDSEINHTPNLDARSIMEESVFKEYVRTHADWYGSITEKIFELGLSVLYYHWLQHD